MNKPFIAIEGPIGVGKSSLAHRLSKTFGFYEEKEIVDENPFLSDFYDDIEKWSFQTEMFFLCNRYKQIRDIESLNQGIVSDYHIFDKFSRIFDILTEDIEMPNTIIFLDADLDVLKSRIAQRNRSFESQIEDDYLLTLKKDYLAYYESLKNDGANVIRIDTSQQDFVKNDYDYQNILNLVKPMIGENKDE
ncbi:MAG: deoxynucleoside kinase [Staphylococcus epidermidis]|nr:deoxynucleoside kinase [Staphylococcus epidermidis]